MNSAKLELISVSSTEVDLETWSPSKHEDVFVCLDLEIGFSDGVVGVNMFYVILATLEALRLRSNESIMAENRVFLVESFEYPAVVEGIQKILDQCSRPSWDGIMFGFEKSFSMGIRKLL